MVDDTRHYGNYVFINKQKKKIKDLTSMTPVYFEEDEDQPGVQNIIIFPGGIQGKHMYIYQNKSNATNDEGDQKNNVLDICEVEMWGCLDKKPDEMNCSCSRNENFAVLPKEILTSVVAWPSISNTLTLKCNQGNVILQQSEDQCDFKPKCVLRYTNKSALFFCSNCTEHIYNTTTTELQHPQPVYTLSVGDNVTYTCKNGHRLAAGNLTRICQENGSWSGEEPICKPCTVATFNASTTDAEYFQPNDTLNVGDNVTYTCKRGHRLAAGNLTRICQENGSWTGEEPYCKRCKCSCKRLASQNFIKDPVVLQQRIEKIKKFLAVNRSELSAFKRKKISSYDGRASSTGIGMTLGVGVITFVIGAIVCSDLLTCRERRRRRAPPKA
ncbi:clotting factor C-like [Magallana gigas]|uniref:clotting factor C-like n=1 Tax=Magallana gigas TaxID=29159 RepID=UPI003340F806